METIIERLQRYTGMNPGAPILFDDAHAKGITYAQLDDLSGRIYSWLKENKIGREDFVLINLPRGVLPVIAMIGVWKAGAAWALVEDTYAPERIRYIREDCGCRLEISAENWDEIMALPALAGHENPDEHDAAYAIYTSGTTGSPKGVLHEYGNLQRAIDSIRIDAERVLRQKLHRLLRHHQEPRGAGQVLPHQAHYHHLPDAVLCAQARQQHGPLPAHAVCGQRARQQSL